MKKLALALIFGLCACSIQLGEKKCQMKPCHKEGAKMFEKMFSESDTDKNGKISKKEWTNSHNGKFAEIDANKDGNLTKEEMKSMHEKMRDKYKEEKKQ